jgi:hypothetical protein
MTSCLEPKDIQEMGNSSLAEFSRRLAAIPEDMCAPFHDEAKSAETELLAVYRVVVMMAKKQEDLTIVANLWETMVAICDQFSTRLGQLVKAHPYCGADTYYDRILDLRSKCHRLQQMHQ